MIGIPKTSFLSRDGGSSLLNEPLLGSSSALCSCRAAGAKADAVSMLGNGSSVVVTTPWFPVAQRLARTRWRCSVSHARAESACSRNLIVNLVGPMIVIAREISAMIARVATLAPSTAAAVT